MFYTPLRYAYLPRLSSPCRRYLLISPIENRGALRFTPRTIAIRNMPILLIAPRRRLRAAAAVMRLRSSFAYESRVHFIDEESCHFIRHV